MKKFALVGAIATLTLAAAACGGGSDTLSEDDYLDELGPNEVDLGPIDEEEIS